MPERPRDLPSAERRMAAVGAVGQVMQAVWALARAQQPKVEAAAADAATWLDWAEEIVDRIAGAPADEDSADKLWVLIGPERAFCGPLARGHLDQLPAVGELGLVGGRLAEVASLDPDLQERVRFVLPAAATADEIPGRASDLAQAVLTHAHGRSVSLLHADGGTPRLRVGRLLTGARQPVLERPETYSPVAEVLEAAVLQAVTGRLAVALAEALRAEVRARLVAADAARRACDRELEELTHAWRVLRQENITQELIELSAATTAARDPIGGGGASTAALLNAALLEEDAHARPSRCD